MKVSGYKLRFFWSGVWFFFCHRTFACLTQYFTQPRMCMMLIGSVTWYLLFFCSNPPNPSNSTVKTSYRDGVASFLSGFSTDRGCMKVLWA